MRRALTILLLGVSLARADGTQPALPLYKVGVRCNAQGFLLRQKELADLAAPGALRRYSPASPALKVAAPVAVCSVDARGKAQWRTISAVTPQCLVFRDSSVADVGDAKVLASATAVVVAPSGPALPAQTVFVVLGDPAILTKEQCTELVINAGKPQIKRVKRCPYQVTEIVIPELQLSFRSSRLSWENLGQDIDGDECPHQPTSLTVAGKEVSRVDNQSGAASDGFTGF